MVKYDILLFLLFVAQLQMGFLVIIIFNNEQTLSSSRKQINNYYNK